MNSKVSSSIVYLLLLTILMSIAYCDSQSIISDLDAKSQAKSADALKKTSLLQDLTTEEINLKQSYASVVQSNLGAVDSYRAYFNEKARCEGLSPDVGFIGEVSAIPDDFCLASPVAVEAVDAYNLQGQQAILQDDIDFAKKIVDEQLALNADVYAELAAYTKLRQDSYVPLQATVKKYHDCMTQYYSDSNPEPAQCADFKTGIDIAADLYGYYRGKEVTFGMSTKGPVFSLDMKKSQVIRANDALTTFLTSAQPRIDNLKATYDICSSNLDNLRTVTNQRLSAALTSRNTINQTKSRIAQIEANLDATIASLKSNTAAMTTLSGNLKQSFA